jgi:hypothetical protein
VAAGADCRPLAAGRGAVKDDDEAGLMARYLLSDKQ